MEGLQVGSRVRVKTAHWARSKSRGTVTEIDPEQKNPLLIQFDIPGIGFDGGMKLWLSEGDLDGDGK